MSSDENTPTKGEQIVRTTLKPGNEDVIANIKKKTAELINLCHEIQAKANADARYCRNHKNFTSEEVNRIVPIAQARYEEAAMWAVKAATV